jgi:hypothetical protein
MLAYLDALVAALAARDTAEIERLLAHPLARTLTRDARADAQAAAAGEAGGAPLRLLQLRHQTAQLLGESNEGVRGAADFHQAFPPSAARVADRRAGTRHQMELPLSA